MKAYQEYASGSGIACSSILMKLFRLEMQTAAFPPLTFITLCPK